MSANPNARLETFCDGVFAIALTLLIIEVKAPHLASEAGPREMWAAIGLLSPNIFAFLLSFGIILIAWVNHHEALKFVNKSSAPFIYANGFMMLTVVFIPFPTSLLGESLLTEHASPAVVLYSGTCAMQAVAWCLMCHTSQPLSINERAVAKGRRAFRDSVKAFAFYTTCAIVAVWFPLPISVVITSSWIIWLIYGIRLKQE